MSQLSPSFHLGAKLAAACLLLLGGVASALPRIYVNSQPNISNIASGTTTPTLAEHTDLGAAAVGKTAKSTFSIVNVPAPVTGGSFDNLTITGVTVSNPAFKVTGPAVTLLTPQASSTFDVTFTAASAGLQTGTVTISSNDPNTPNFTFAVQAEGGLPKIRISGNGIDLPNPSATTSIASGTDFGPVSTSVQVTHEIVIHNDGEGVLILNLPRLGGYFSLMDGRSLVIQPFSSAPLHIAFAGTASTTPTVTSLVISSNDPTAATFPVYFSGSGLTPGAVVTGKGVTIPANATTPRTEDDTNMGETTLGLGDLTAVYAIDNSGPGILVLDDFRTGNPNRFTVSALPAEATQIAPGARGYIQVTFHPDAVGTFSDYVAFHTNDPAFGYNFSFQVSAVALDAALQVGTIDNGDGVPDASDGTDFGGVRIGSGGLTHNFPLTNTGPGVLQIQELSITPATGFRIGSVSKGLLAAGETVQLPVIFDPSAMTPSTATVSIQTVGHSPFTFAVKGFGLTGVLSVGAEGAVIARNDLAPSAADGTDLGGILLEQGTLVRSIPLRNTGNAPLTITRIMSTNAGEFIPMLGDGGPATIPAGGSLDLKVHFRPAGSGPRQSTLTIESDDLASDYVFAVAGTGLTRVNTPAAPASDPVLTATPVTASSAGTFVGLLQNHDEGYTVSRGGFDNFRINTNGTFTAKGDIDGLAITLKGKFNDDGSWQGVQTLADHTTVSITLAAFTGADGSLRLIGSLERDGITLDLDLVRSGKLVTPAGMVGSYTLVIPAEDTAQPNVPHGDGIGTMTVAADGTIRAKITLADGTAVTRTGLLSPGYRWQFRFAPYAGGYKNGGISGEIVFRETPGISDLDGTLAWQRATTVKSKIYPYGFDIIRGVAGSKYIEPAKGAAVLPDLGVYGFATLQTGPSLEHQDQASTQLSWSSADRITVTTAPASKLTVNRKTGLITGTLVDPATKVKTSVSAVLLQKQKLAAGFYKDTASTGFVLIHAEAN